jgi:hypothetical protein
MMKTTFVACKTLEDEIKNAIKGTAGDYDIHWIESGLHNYPDKLKSTLQEHIDSITGSDYIVLIFGLCGNALLGLGSKESTLVIPRVDDCISLFLGGNSKRRDGEQAVRAYYLTKGWLRYENNIWKEYSKSIERYGLEKTRSIFKIMLKHYTHLVVIDTGAYNLEDFIEETKEIAEELGLEHKVVPAELDLLNAALNNNWDQGFALIEPGQKVTLQDMGSCETASLQGFQFKDS